MKRGYMTQRSRKQLGSNNKCYPSDAPGFPGKRVDDGNKTSGSLTIRATNEHHTTHDMGYNSRPTMTGAQRDQKSER